MTADQPTLQPNAAPERPYQFRIIHLLIATAVVALVLGVIVGIPNLIRVARESARESFCRDSVSILATVILSAVHRCEVDRSQHLPAWRRLDLDRDCRGLRLVLVARWTAQFPRRVRVASAVWTGADDIVPLSRQAVWLKVAEPATCRGPRGTCG